MVQQERKDATHGSAVLEKNNNNNDNSKCFSCGLVTGAVSAGLFNPYDRALFLMHLHKRPFLSLSNFKRPYEGFHQSVFHRIVSGGMYFPLEDKCRDLTYSSTLVISPFTRNTIAGMLAGSLIAISTNPLAVIKYQSWGNAGARGQMFKTAKDMVTRGGMQAFSRGIHLTVLRDIVWGGTYAGLRNWLPEKLLFLGTSTGFIAKDASAPSKTKPGVISFTSNMIAGGIGTMISSPINYCRNMAYGHNVAHEARGVMSILGDLVHDTNVHHARSGRSRASYFLGRLAIGWGTLRVALGLAVSSQIYIECCALSVWD